MFGAVVYLVLAVFLLPLVLGKGWWFRVYLLVVGGFLSLVWLDHFWQSSRASYDLGPGGGLGLVLFAFLAVGFICGLVLKIAVIPLSAAAMRLYREKNAAPLAAIATPGRITVIGACVGHMIWFMAILTAAQPGYWLTIISTVAAFLGARALWFRRYVTDVVRATAATMPAEAPQFSGTKLARELCWWGAALCVVMTIYSVYVMFAVESKAKALAGAQAFCVQVPNANKYEALSSRSQMLGFRMLGRGSLHHAVLVIGPPAEAVLYHWSYRNNDFMPGTFGRPPIYCMPRTSFFENLRDADPGPRKVVRFHHHGIDYAIPEDYTPDTGSDGTVRFLAIAPTFAPGMGVMCADKLCHFTDFSFSNWAIGWNRQISADDRVEEAGMFHGLRKQRILSPSLSSARVHYSLPPSAGNAETVISCFEGSATQCNHAFTREGITYHFSHMSEDLPNWRAMQQALYDLRQSFISKVR